MENSNKILKIDLRSSYTASEHITSILYHVFIFNRRSSIYSLSTADNVFMAISSVVIINIYTKYMNHFSLQNVRFITVNPYRMGRRRQQQYIEFIMRAACRGHYTFFFSFYLTHLLLDAPQLLCKRLILVATLVYVLTRFQQIKLFNVFDMLFNVIQKNNNKIMWYQHTE